MGSPSTSSDSVLPVFLKKKDIPDSVNTRPTVLEICLAAEKVAGSGSILGAQEIRAIWRVYPTTKEARTALLVKGLRLRNVVLQVSNTNPYVLRDSLSGEEKPSTKVWIDDIPLSVAGSEIEHALTSIGCELRSEIKEDRARDADGKLTRFVTGRRFVFITVPSKPLEKTLKVSIFTAKLYHKEQKAIRKTIVCSRCLLTDHHVSACTNDVVCRVCKLPGHKRGDPKCALLSTAASEQQEGSSASTSSASPTATTSGASKLGGGGRWGDMGNGRERGRREDRVRILDQSRSRSGTPTKRSRSKEKSPTEAAAKQAKLVNDSSPDLDEALAEELTNEWPN